jgi:phage baseplate assembly protein V
MTGDSTQQALADLVRDGRSYIEIGTITETEAHEAWGYLYTGTLQPSGQEFQGRPLHVGTADAGGEFWPIAVGDEVLVLCPGGEINRAVVVGGLTSSAAAVPSDWDNAQPQLTHPSGKVFRTAEGADVETVLLSETFQGDAATWESALYTFMSAAASATSVGDLVAAALAWGLSCGSYKDNLAAGSYSAAALKSE